MPIIQELIYKIITDSKGFKEGKDEVEKEVKDLGKTFEGSSKTAKKESDKLGKALETTRKKVVKESKQTTEALNAIAEATKSLSRGGVNGLSGFSNALGGVIGGFGAFGALAATIAGGLGAAKTIHDDFQKGITGNAERITLGQLSRRTGLSERSLSSGQQVASTRYGVDTGEYNAFQLKNAYFAQQNVTRTNPVTAEEIQMRRWFSEVGIDSTKLRTTSSVENAYRILFAKRPQIASQVASTLGISPGLQELLSDSGYRGLYQGAYMANLNSGERTQTAQEQAEWQLYKRSRGAIAERYQSEIEASTEKLKGFNNALGTVKSWWDKLGWSATIHAYAEEEISDYIRSVEKGERKSNLPLEELYRERERINQISNGDDRHREAIKLLDRLGLTASGRIQESLMNSQSYNMPVNNSGDTITIQNVNVNSNPDTAAALAQDISNQAKNNKTGIAFARGSH